MKSCLCIFRRSAGFQAAVSHGFQPADATKRLTPPEGAEDWKSAIRQAGNIANLRYALLLLLLTGCLFRPATVSPRHFVLSPITTNEPASAPTGHLSIGIAHVKMPPYLLRDSIAYRDRTNEIGYLEDALWGERLDQSFQRTLVVNLSQLLASDSIYAVDSAHNQTMPCVLLNVQQFDVDTFGRGTLIAQWRIVGPEKETPLKTGRAELTRPGASPRRHPEAIATTLSNLEADFSHELAQAISGVEMLTNNRHPK